MNTNEFAQDLLHGIKYILSHLGVPQNILNQLDIAIYLILILVIAIIAERIVHSGILHFSRRILKYKQLTVLSNLIEYNALKRLSYIIPPLIMAALLPFAFPHDTATLNILEKITWIYFFIMLSISINTVLSSVGDAMMTNGELHDRPIKGFIQIMQVLFSCIIVIVVISILINKSPINLITGLGAFAAVLMLIFKDSILGFVAGVLLAKNDMIHIGDWIEIEGSSVNGTVIDISLTIVKVQNFDNTIVTIPPYTLVTQEFINWRGMSESGGRRIMRQYDLKLDYIKPCTPEFLERMKQFDEDLATYISTKQQQANEGKVANTENPAGLVNGTIETNAGLLRAYMNIYLKRHPSINQDLLVMVRTLAPTANGLPLQLWCFSANKVWPSYESIQAEIMEHFVSVLPYFELYPFQNPSSRDYILSGLLEGGTQADQLYGIPWNTLRPHQEEKNEETQKS